jgi:hypothetical protein
MNQQRKIHEATSVVQTNRDPAYHKVRVEMQYEFQRLKQRRGKQIEDENQKLYKRLKGILSVSPNAPDLA